MNDSIRFSDLCMEGVKSLKPYEPGKPISEIEREYGVSDVVKLASNENPIGPSPKAVEAMEKALPDLALYPDGNGFELKRALSERFGVATESITLGTGSDHILELVARAFLGPGRSAVVSQYAFAIYNIVTKAASAELRVADANEPDHGEMPYGHDLAGMLEQVDETTRVVFIANPNNPTGTWIDRGTLEAFLDRLPKDVLVVLDEAYFDFVDHPEYPDGVRFMDEYPNVIVMRTFSKAYGLAGVRVGYAFANPEVTDLINRVRLSFNPNTLAQVAAVAALDDRDHLRRTLDVNEKGLVQLRQAFADMGLATIPSVCNFITVDVERPGREVFEELLREGVIVRPLDGYGLDTHLRVSVGTAEQNERAIAAMKKATGR